MLETDRLRLTPVEQADTESIADLYSDPDVMRYVTVRPLSFEIAQESVERGIQHWLDHGFGMFSVFDRESGAFVGRCGIVHMKGSNDVEVAYILRKESWGRGYATEAARACVEFGFVNHALPEILGLTFLDNVASQLVLQKCGLRFSGTRYRQAHHLLLFAVKGPSLIQC